jgi:hypothetical protein
MMRSCTVPLFQLTVGFGGLPHGRGPAARPSLFGETVLDAPGATPTLTDAGLQRWDRVGRLTTVT